MAGITSIHHVALWTDRFDETVAFYRDGLGLTPIYAFGKPEARAMILRCGEHATHGHVEVFERDPQDDAAAAPEARLLHFAFGTKDVDAAYQAALDAGATPRMEPRTSNGENLLPPNARPAGAERMRQRYAFVTGLNGEIVEFFDDPLAR